MHAMASERKATVDRNDAVILEWRYTPADFFGEPVDITGPDYEIHIEGGEARAYVVPEAYDEEHKKRDELHDVVEARFLAQQVLTHRTYELPKPGMSRVHPDGGREVNLFVHDTVHTQASCHLDLVVSDAAGNVVLDTKRERLDRERAFREAVAWVLPGDPLLRKLLLSYQGAVGDPEDELTRLYEIRDAAATHFGGERPAQETLGISSAAWKRLGLLANAVPVEQGRHRGKHHEPLRKATAAELEEARGIARELIEAYVRYADRGCRSTCGIQSRQRPAC